LVRSDFEIPYSCSLTPVHVSLLYMR